MSKRSALYDKWSEEETLKLIRARIQHDYMFTSKICDQKNVRTRVATEAGVQRPIDKVRKKWQNLIAKYKNIKEPPSGRSTEDGAELPTSWPYYNEMDEFMASRHNINPPLIITSVGDEPSATEEHGPDEVHEVTDFEDNESHFSFQQVFSSRPASTRSSHSSAENSAIAGSSGLIRQRSQSRSSHARSKRKLSKLEIEELKTNKKIRKVATLFEQYMREKLNISISSSSSNSE